MSFLVLGTAQVVKPVEMVEVEDFKKIDDASPVFKPGKVQDSTDEPVKTNYIDICTFDYYLTML